MYTAFLPADDPREYLHLAGRVGRIGQQGSVRGQGGRVTTVLDPEDAAKYEEMASFLGFEFTDIEAPKQEMNNDADLDESRRNLEDLLTLVEAAPDLESSDDDDLFENDDEHSAEDDDDDEGYDDTFYPLTLDS